MHHWSISFSRESICALNLFLLYLQHNYMSTYTYKLLNLIHIIRECIVNFCYSRNHDMIYCFTWEKRVLCRVGGYYKCILSPRVASMLMICYTGWSLCAIKALLSNRFISLPIVNYIQCKLTAACNHAILRTDVSAQWHIFPLLILILIFPILISINFSFSIFILI